VLRHHQPQDGVAEELQSLVGRQPAPLVGERAVGQGAIEQLGINTLPELGEQIARREAGDDWLGPDQDDRT
jgi:hypothetical protein